MLINRSRNVVVVMKDAFSLERGIKPILLIQVLSTVFAAALTAAEGSAPPARESIEWCDIWISHANETNLPRVLLIGDSIARDYYPEVEKRLAGKAFVARLATSRFATDPVLRKEIALVLDQAKFEVIHFNNGMHGWQHSEADYRRALPQLIETIRTHAPNAKLVWGTTTSLRDGKAITWDTKVEYSNDRIAARNTLAAEIVNAQKIATVDLNEAVRGRPDLHSDNVHFNSQGSQLLASRVCEAVAKLLLP
jgi:hypothetical protein